MTEINAKGMGFRELNELVRQTEGDLLIENCEGQRFMLASRGKCAVKLTGTPGNALGCYMNGADVFVDGSVQDAVGDTMNAGRITVFGSAGDALGYAMRGGEIYVRGDSGYRTGIHIKQYKEHRPVIVIGGAAGAFLGEYMAGGIIIVLNLTKERELAAFAGTGMHGGKIFVRLKKRPEGLPAQVAVSETSLEEMREIEPYLDSFAERFDTEIPSGSTFFTLSPNAANPYTQMYTHI